MVRLSIIPLYILLLHSGRVGWGLTEPDSAIANSCFLELVSLRETQDPSHRTPIKDCDGKTWYREEAAGVDLRHLELEDTTIMTLEEGKEYAVMFCVQRKHRERLCLWCQKRIEKTIGIICDGTLYQVSPLQSELNGFFVLSGIETLNDAFRICAGVRVGGDQVRIDSAFVEVQEEYLRKQAKHNLLREKYRPPPPPEDALEIVSLRKIRDDAHTQPIQKSDGTWWYREPEAGLDLRHCETSSLGGMDNAAYGFRAKVKEEYIKSFAQWCEQRVGKHFGFVSEGQLMFVNIMPGALVDKLNRLTLIIEPAFESGQSTNPDDQSSNEKPLLEFSLQRELARAIVISSDYLQIVSLQKKKDGPHSDPIKDAGGTVWYRPEEAVLSLHQLCFSDATISGAFDGNYRLCVPIQDEVYEEAAEWYSGHEGEAFGIILEGKLVRIGEIAGHLPKSVDVAEYTDWEKVTQQRSIIQNGGTKK